MPSNLFVFLIFLGTLVSIKFRKTGFGLMSLAALFILMFGIFPTSSFLMRDFENRYLTPSDLPKQIDGIIVLGGALDTTLSHERQMAHVNGNAERIFTMFKLARDYREAKVIHTGGNGSFQYQGIATEAQVVERILSDLGSDKNRFILEDQSRNTFENAVFSKQLIGPKDGETWLLVTSAFHMPRSMAVFKKQGWEVIPYPVDYKVSQILSFWPKNLHINDNLRLLDIVVREYIGMLAYKITGKI